MKIPKHYDIKKLIKVNNKFRKIEINKIANTTFSKKQKIEIIKGINEFYDGANEKLKR